MASRGAPVGNQNAARGKLWRAAIERALERRKPANERIKAIDELADRLLSACYKGDLSALQELGNRLDGRPVSILCDSVEGQESVLLRVEFVSPAHADQERVVAK
jgi:hypothetical protein